jgi:hypothetical protein
MVTDSVVIITTTKEPKLESPQTIESLLLTIEAEGETAGWDSDLSRPMLFAILQEGDQLVVDWSESIDEMFQATLYITQGNVGPALQLLTSIIRQLEWRAADELVGLGMRCEIWGLITQHALDGPVNISEHPDRVEGRQVWYCGRNGDRTSVIRHRGNHPTLTRQNDDCGQVPNAMTRWLNAICPEDIPVVPIAKENW